MFLLTLMNLFQPALTRSGLPSPSKSADVTLIGLLSQSQKIGFRKVPSPRRTSRAVQEAQRDHEAVLNEFSFVVATDTWNGVGNCISEPGLNFPEKQVFCGVIHQHGF